MFGHTLEKIGPHSYCSRLRAARCKFVLACSHPSMASTSQPAAPSIAVTTAVVQGVGNKFLFPPFGVKHEESTTVAAIVSDALEKVVSRGHGCPTVESVTCFSDREMQGIGTELALSQLSSTTVVDLRDDYGKVIKISIAINGESFSSPRVLPSGAAKVMDASKAVDLPTPPVDTSRRFEHARWRRWSVLSKGSCLKVWHRPWHSCRRWR